MIEDVTADERAARAATEGGFVTYKQQISFGLHVIVMMGAFYAFGHVAGMALTTNRSLVGRRKLFIFFYSDHQRIIVVQVPPPTSDGEILVPLFPLRSEMILS